MKSIQVKEHAAWSRFIQYLLIVCFFIFTVYPLIWLIIASLKTNQGFLNSPWEIPTVLQWSNYTKAWSVGGIQRYFMNSLIVVGASVLGMLITSLPAAFALIRMRFRLQRFLLALILFGLIVPGHSVVVPLFQTLNWLHLRSTLWTMIIPYVAFAIPISVMILSGRLRTLSRELEEAAVMDGCGPIRLFFRITIPLLKAEIVTITIINFIWMWNELFFAMVFTSTDDLRTLPFGLLNFVGQYGTDWTAMFAALIISFIPLFVLYLLLQRYIVGGMTAGSIKG